MDWIYLFPQVRGHIGRGRKAGTYQSVPRSHLVRAWDENLWSPVAVTLRTRTASQGADSAGDMGTWDEIPETWDENLESAKRNIVPRIWDENLGFRGPSLVVGGQL